MSRRGRKQSVPSTAARPAAPPESHPTPAVARRVNKPVALAAAEAARKIAGKLHTTVVRREVPPVPAAPPVPPPPAARRGTVDVRSADGTRLSALAADADADAAAAPPAEASDLAALAARWPVDVPAAVLSLGKATNAAPPPAEIDAAPFAIAIFGASPPDADGTDEPTALDDSEDFSMKRKSRKSSSSASGNGHAGEGAALVAESPAEESAPPPSRERTAGAPAVGSPAHSLSAALIAHREGLRDVEPEADEPTEAAPAPQPPLLFECAWEVCWQLGGIYTVLRSKAQTMIDHWGDRYCLIGPYNPATAALEFEPDEPGGYLNDAVQRVRDAGIPCHVGTWLVAGHPRVVLLDYRALFGSLDHDKYLLWKDHGITTPTNDGEVNEVVAFGFAVAAFFTHLKTVVPDRPVIAHFHEWMGGVAVPRMAHLRVPVSTVFTTHATLLGRYLANDNAYFYQHLPFYADPDGEAQRFNILSRHQIEKAAAHASTVFTTVSEVTAVEAERLLGRKPDAILPNGLNIQRFSAIHEFQNLHRQYKEKIHQFVMGHFFPAYHFDLDRTIYFFTSGRYEYRNKGMDLFIEALFRLNHRLRHVPDRPTVVAFIVTKAPVRHINVNVLQNQMMFDELRSTCTHLQEELGNQLFLTCAKGRLPQAQDLLGQDAQVRLKRAMHAWRTGQPPVIVTHDLIDDAKDPVLNQIRHRGLFNSADDPVKMVFHPQFMAATSPLLGLDYEQFVRGCHMGVFPSYYEPWGYTPMESAALGVPAVTTDLSGFGAYVQHHIPGSKEQGIFVLNRRNRGFDEAADELARYLFDFVQLGRRQRIELRNKVEQLSELFDWSVLIKHYVEAHRLALERIGARAAGEVLVRMA